MHIPLVYEHLLYKYFVRRSVGQAKKRQKSFATYGCCHPCHHYEGKISFCNIIKIEAEKNHLLCLYLKGTFAVSLLYHYFLNFSQFCLWAAPNFGQFTAGAQLKKSRVRRHCFSQCTATPANKYQLIPTKKLKIQKPSIIISLSSVTLFFVKQQLQPQKSQ